MIVKQNAHTPGQGECFWQILDGDLDMFVCLCQRKGESADASTDIDDSGVFRKREL